MWQTDEGLPQNSVQALIQSRDGYLWLGTLRGLARFDGVHFKIFDPQNTPELQNPSVTALCETRDRSLWIGTGGGGVTQMQDGRFVHHLFGADTRAHNIKCILEGRDGTIWVGTWGGLFAYREGNWTNYTVKDGLLDNVVRSLLEVDDELWIGTGSGLSIMKQGVISKRKIPFTPEKISIRTLLRDRRGRMWLGMTEGLISVDEGKVYLKKDGLPDNNVTALYEDSRGILWAGTYGGLSRLENGQFIVEKDYAGVFFDQINAIMEDAEGDLWVGARDGLHQLRPKRLLTYTRQQGLTANNITSVLEDRRGSIWIGTWGGGIMRLKNGQIAAFTQENPESGLETALVLSLYEDRDGSIFAGGDYETGTFRYDGKKFNRFWSQEEALTNRVIRVIYRDREDTLWFGASPGLVNGNTSQRFLDRAEIRCILEDHEGTLWVGSNLGLYRRDDGNFARVNLPGSNSFRMVLSFYEDREKNLWVGIEGLGLCRYRDGSFTRYSRQQGLWSDEIFEILEDDNGWLWMSCPKGIFRVKKENLSELDQGHVTEITSIAYGKADGMESIQCSGVAQPAGWHGHDGRLWFATTKGLVMTDPNVGPSINQRPPPVKIEEVLADRHPLTLNGSTVQIGPGRGEVEFHYTALSFQAPEKVRFRYRLAGVDPEWVDAGNRRVAYYNNLKPGRYQFEVKACNNDGIWNEESAKLGMALAPHIYQSWWFSSVMVAAVAGLIAGSVRYTTRRKLRWELERLEHQNAIEKERTRIAQDMHDDLGARLTEILLLNELARKNSGSSDRLENYLAKQSHVVRDVAASLDTIVWAVSPINDSQDRLANYLYEQVERLLAMSSMRCRFDVPDSLPDTFVSSEVRHNLFMVVRESLNNIINHSGATEVWFRLRTTSSTISIVIEDNGKGISSSDRSTCGNGLQNMERRMKNLGGSFRLTSEPGKGTHIRLEVPLKAVANA